MSYWDWDYQWNNENSTWTDCYRNSNTGSTGTNCTTQTRTTTTTTTTTSTRMGQQLVVDDYTTVQTIGNFVTDVSLNPYISSRIISFVAWGMRPNCRLHVFFDSILMDDYCAPGTFPTGSFDSSDYHSVPRTGDWGTAITTDATGKCAGQFNIPAATFKVGDRILELADVDSLVLGGNAFSTMASATFTASSLNVTKQTATLTTVNPIIRSVPTTETVITVNTVVNTVVIPPPPPPPPPPPVDPIAQALTITTPSQQAGIFATKIDVYFQQKSQVLENGVTLYLCDTDNGYPDGDSILPFSMVHLNDADINVSNDATVATTFSFEAPVFMSNAKEYAFVIRPDANDPDFRVWCAKLGDFDVTTGIQVFSQPVVGTAFYGATAQQWTALQTEYLKFTLYRADFLYPEGDAILQNANNEYIYLYYNSTTYSNSSVGILPGDVIYGATSNTWSDANTDIKGRMQYYDLQRALFYVANSTGSFNTVNYVQIHRFTNNSVETPNSTSMIAHANVWAMNNPIVDALCSQYAFMTPAGTDIAFGYKGYSNSWSVDANYNTVLSGTETSFHDHERIVGSRSSEQTYAGGNKTVVVDIHMGTDTSFLSPMVDLVKSNELAIQNLIDPISSNYNEFFNNGPALSKYVSQVVTLAHDQDAQDLQVILSACRPPGSDIQVWARFVNGEDGDIIENKTWAPMRNTSLDMYTSPIDETDFKEYTFVTCSYYPMLRANGLVTTTSSCTDVTGVGTNFDFQFEPGWWINMVGNSTSGELSGQILSIANSTSMTTTIPFTMDHTSNIFFLVAPPTTPWCSANRTRQITGTVTANSGNNTVVGSATAFKTDLSMGGIIGIDGDQQAIIAIANDTNLTVGQPWTSNVAGVNAFAITPAGLSYLNSNGSLYTTFKKFQIKIILQSNDSCRVPILDNLRVLALQL